MKNLIFVLALILAQSSMMADSWTDPTWKKMIKESDVITLVEYVSNGDFRAQAKIVKIYKGKINSDLIWITGFSNRYGPIDKMKIGEKFIVFLNKNKASKSNLEYWKEKIKEDKELIPFYNALKVGKAYSVWTPTSGDLRVKSNKVQYDLLQTTFYENQKFYSLKEFESFLNAFDKGKKEFHKYLISELKNNLSNDKTSQFLMMLYLTSFKKYNSVYESIYDINQDNSVYALVKLLSNIKGDKSRDLLVKLLDSKNSVVQGEAVRQLSNESSDFIGPILMTKLSKAGEEGIYPQNLMDPVRNSIDGGKIEIIRTLGKLKYKPAIKKLLPLLKTEEKYIFKLTIEVLIELGSRDFIPYLNEHLRKGTKPLIFEICQIITENDLEECKPALMEFISSHNRNDHPSYEYTISKHVGLAHFDNQETRNFLIKDFENLLINNDTIESRQLKDWIREYIDTFKALKSRNARPYIYKSLFKWFGYNEDFAKYPELFELKKSLENSITEKATNLLKEHNINKIKSIVFINNTKDYGINFTPSYDQIVLIELKPVKMNLSENKEIWKKLQSARKRLSKELNVSLEKIGAISGSYVSNLNNRFEVNIDWSPMGRFYKYAVELPDMLDLSFLKSLTKSGFAKTEFDKRQLKKTIEKVELKLKK